MVNGPCPQTLLCRWWSDNCEKLLLYIASDSDQSRACFILEKGKTFLTMEFEGGHRSGSWSMTFDIDCTMKAAQRSEEDKNWMGLWALKFLHGKYYKQEEPRAMSKKWETQKSKLYGFTVIKFICMVWKTIIRRGVHWLTPGADKWGAHVPASQMTSSLQNEFLSIWLLLTCCSCRHSLIRLLVQGP